MASISSFKSSDLEGLTADNAEDGPPRLETLILNNTNISDDATPFISSCENLQTLEVASTKMSGVSLGLPERLMIP